MGRAHPVLTRAALRIVHRQRSLNAPFLLQRSPCRPFFTSTNRLPARCTKNPFAMPPLSCSPSAGMIQRISGKRLRISSSCCLAVRSARSSRRRPNTLRHMCHT
jgi:hypothetical protein